MLAERRLTLKLDLEQPHFPLYLKESAVVLSPENFSKAKNLLGQEFDWILYDARSSLNLDALAIAIGTLRAGGELVLWLDENQQIDLDSLRWSGVEQGIETPNFKRHFYALLTKYFGENSMFDACDQKVSELSLVGLKPTVPVATVQQSDILDQILQQQSDLYILTAKRGRGKSALAGMLINALSSNCYVTAPNKSAVKTMQDFAEQPLKFIAPDELVQQIKNRANQFSEDWLFIDEAARLPLPLLFQLLSTFKHIVMTTTVHSYEGTGRGFLLKFLANLHRTYQHIELTQPLRWTEGDKLEQFIDELLLLEAEDCLIQPAFKAQSQVVCRSALQGEIIARIKDFYGLLTMAHYRTSPLDLRRLFDAPNQQFYLAELDNMLLGSIWSVEEGGLIDSTLIEYICRGQRRPKGNLVAQSLAFYYHYPQACQLRSLRISRIAVQPNWQNQGVGQKLIAELLANVNVDFISVSFGYTKPLSQFWQKCGFVLVQIGEYQEASSGCYSAIALRGLSKQGKELVQKARIQFERDFPLTSHALISELEVKEINWQLDLQDFCILQNFAEFHRTFISSFAAIRRLVAQSDKTLCPLLSQYCATFIADKSIQGGKKAWLSACRQEVSILLEKSGMMNLTY